ncbi:hypothetical protein BDN70DRAFT_803781 [Pholiota conissans]|uniref:Uncharacterized protein n=1 Tax=Pholiota conissans TaxID=109636 RepID=A0A9P5Z6S0_9AGAR|nr:hypothetical protein BDN70DRAFT_803781 [Pholiota conissans]
MLSLERAGVYNIGGLTSRPKYHIAQGAFVGDVGWLNERGTFYYCFNVFHPPDHPIQRETLPPNFCAFDPPLSTGDVRTIPNYFPPGTILCSEGIQQTWISTSPFFLHRKVEFIANAREGAVLILPNGATREELVNPSSIHEYVKDHAVSWYQFFNGESDDTAETPTPNSAL